MMSTTALVPSCASRSAFLGRCRQSNRISRRGEEALQVQSYLGTYMPGRNDPTCADDTPADWVFWASDGHLDAAIDHERMKCRRGAQDSSRLAAKHVRFQSLGQASRLVPVVAHQSSVPFPCQAEESFFSAGRSAAKWSLGRRAVRPESKGRHPQGALDTPGGRGVFCRRSLIDRSPRRSGR